MRVSLLTLLALLWGAYLYAQPANDECPGAVQLNLSTPPACPNTNFVTNTFNSNNTNATPTSPYPVFEGCSGGQTQGPAAEVWYSFTATGGNTEIQLTGGLSNFNMVLFQGGACGFLVAIECATGGSGVTMVGNTIPGQQYFLMVSGGDIDDQGNFSIRIRSSRLCGVCYQPETVTVTYNPPPVNGTYSSGQNVQICVTVNEWEGNAAGTIEWLHACTFTFGDNWDVNSIIANPPPSCDGSGSWDWYDMWTGCNTGQTFGPGFAYDSSSGIGCGGAPNDGDPGNNWGDGAGGCSDIPDSAAPVEFCLQITVNDCPPAVTGGNLGVGVNIYSDGDSGSWTQTGCNSGQGTSFLASVICCDDEDPIVFTVDATCPGVSDGSMTISGNAGLDPTQVFNYTVLENGTSIVYECPSCPSVITTPNVFAAGIYTVVAVNIATNCSRSVIVEISEGPPPTAMAELTNMPCLGSPGLLMGSIDPPDPGADYFWEGPNGFESNQQNPQVFDPGTYTLTVSSSQGCEADPVTVDVEFIEVEAEIDAPTPYGCFGANVELYGSGGTSYAWENLTTGQSLGTGPFISPALTMTSTIQVTVTDDNGCTDVANIEIEVFDLPEITFDIAGSACQGGILVITAQGAGPGGSYTWADNPTAPNPRLIPETTPAGQYTLSVSGTNALGCIGQGQVTFDILPPINAQVSASQTSICAGQSVTLTATGGTSYVWSSGQNGPSTISVSPATTTTYTVTVSNNSGCQSTANVTINVSAPVPAPVITCGPATPSSVVFNWGAVAGAVSYNYTINGGPIQNTTGTTATATGLSPGQAVTIVVTPVTAGPSACTPQSATLICTSQNCPPVSVSINPVNDVCLSGTPPAPIDLEATISSSGGTTVWSGPGITNAQTGIFEPVTAGPGAHPLVVAYTEGLCTYRDTLVVNVFNTPTADFTAAPTPVCTGQSATVTFTGSAPPSATFTWDFAGGMATPGTGAGPHTVTWATPGSKTISLTVSASGCTSSEVTQTVNVVSPLVAPVVSCGPATTTSVTFNWAAVAGASGYTVTVLTGQTGVQSGTSYTVSGLSPEEVVTIRVTAETTNPCGPVSTDFSCAAQACPDFALSIDPVADICLTAGLGTDTLTAITSGGAGNGVRLWSGPGIVNGSLGVFDPIAAGPGAHTITLRYTEGPCFEEVSTTIRVFAVPTSTFTALPTPVCINQPTTVTYTGTAGAGATFTWNFNGGSATPGTGAGPHQVSWATAGNRTITLTVQENGCSSGSSSQTVAVQAPLPAPVINCETTVNSITFTWNPVPGAASYQVNVISGTPGILQDTSYIVTGLSANDEVEIQVVAVGTGPCGNSTATANCVAQDCPDVIIAIAPVAPICLDATAAPVTLSANITGGAGGGTSTWSGPGVSAATGVFDPDAAGVGSHTLTLNYQEGNCTYNSSITIVVNPQPTADFTAPGPVCVDEETTVTYTGSADSGATFNWDFAGGTAVPGTGVGPHQVSWPTAGTQAVTLTVVENGCASEPVSVNVGVEAPLSAPAINCSSTINSVTFSWADVAGATGYTVTVLEGPMGVQTGNSYTISGLDPGETVTIRVTAQTANVCGPVSSELQCAASACPPLSFDATTYGPFCLDAGVQTLTPGISGGAGTGTFVWSGTGITSPSGTFNPAVAGAGVATVSLMYTEGNCMADTTYEITVLPKPTANFTVESPICITGAATFTYTGSAAAGATYNWNFGGGVAVPGVGQGPHEVSWSTAGAKSVSLTVVENGCASDPFNRSVQVDAELPAFNVNCQSTTTSSVVFAWTPVPGATGYTVTVVSGPAGTQSGTTYTVSGLTPNQEVSIQVTANGNTVCGPVSATATCVAQACPPLSVAISGITEVCAGESATVSFDFSGASAGPFVVTYTVNGGAPQTTTLNDGGQITLSNLQATATVNVVSIVDNSLPTCSYPGNATRTIQVSPRVTAGTPLADLRLCVNTPNVVDLRTLLQGAQAGGQWTEISASPSTGGAFNAAAASFNTALQQPGSYRFRYTVEGGVCPDATAEVNVVLTPAPVADAGLDQELTCNTGSIVIGGNNTTTGPGVSYLWTADPLTIDIATPNDRTTEASQPGAYTLQVTNADGCVARDVVVVSSDFGAPVGDVSVADVSCFEAADGAILIENVTGGQPPYQYSLNGGAFTGTPLFSGLGPDQYTLTIRDQNGCFTELVLDVTQPEQLTVRLATDLEGEANEIELGQSVTLQAIFNPNVQVDTIIWRPDSIGMGNEPRVVVSPLETTSYTVTVIDINGCSDSDNLNLIVRKSRPVYIPNAFSPNDDGVNDVLFIQAPDGLIRNINSFMVFNRWGESVFEAFDFQPNTPAVGWNGRFRDQALNAAVYAYVAEIEFTDGEVVIFKGDVILVK